MHHHQDKSSSPDSGPDRLQTLKEMIQHAAHLLPAQGPISVFIHHNTLHAFEQLPFDEAVRRGAQVFGCEPYLHEVRYREELSRGRITTKDLEAILRAENHVDHIVAGLCSRYALRLAMLTHPLQTATDVELNWWLANTRGLDRLREDAAAGMRERLVGSTRAWVESCFSGDKYFTVDANAGDEQQELCKTLSEVMRQTRSLDSASSKWTPAQWESFSLRLLWQICTHCLPYVSRDQTEPITSLRMRDRVLTATGKDSDLLVHDILIKFCAAYLDQGLSLWHLPDREKGFWYAFNALYQSGPKSPAGWLNQLSAELQRIEKVGMTPLDSIEESLCLFGIAPDNHQEYIAQTFLSLRGWAGMLHHLETRGDRVAHPAPEGSLTEYLAAFLLLERLATRHLARTTGIPQEQMDDAIPPRTVENATAQQPAFVVFQLAQVLGWLPVDLFHLGAKQWKELLTEVDGFDSIERRRVFHSAYERHYRHQVLDAIAVQARREPEPERHFRFQAVTCIDEREESFRRHLEEIAPDVQTFGAAGFFSIAMYYSGVDDAHFVPLCPVVVRPQHWVKERVGVKSLHEESRHTRFRTWLGHLYHRTQLETRGFLVGSIVIAFVGLIATLPLILRVIFPRASTRLQDWIRRTLRPSLDTYLTLQAELQESYHDHTLGFRLDEMVSIVERLLRDIGLTRQFSRLVFIVGHGSSSLNNPHESAHDCGACGGARGGPNARAFALMANDPTVRGQLRDRGIEIPAETCFVGAYHNTCNEDLIFFDLERLPASHQRDFARADQDWQQARAWAAHERSRRFESAPTTFSLEAVMRHVQGRAVDLSQVRPEYGHATNSVCVVARRARTRGLYMDRRAFLVSYDPDQDSAECAILTRILQAVVPVCGGISLEYYFSYVDPTGWGCGTKLPHNVTSLLGVMDGAASDLRTGLPWQMVEIHDPVRILFILEAEPDDVLSIIEKNPPIAQMLRNGWVQLATLSPSDSTIHCFENHQFSRYVPEHETLPEITASKEWYHGKREHLGFALLPRLVWGTHRETIS